MSKKSVGNIQNKELAACLFCHRDTDDANLLGQKFHRDDIVVHYFCLLFASGLCQRGKTDKQGIMGFLPDDIKKELRRAKKLKCSFCKSNGATIGCVMSKCRITFHLPCGQEHGVLTQFMDEFKAFCEAHRPKQITPTQESAVDDGTSFICVICMNNVETKPSNNVLYAPCCKNSWFHRNCLQHHATSSGLHFFRCPLCNDKDEFQKEMLKLGIYIPDQDAAWEREPNAFQELLVRHDQCDAVKCLCYYGRKYTSESSKWKLVLCDWCGSNGTHLACSKLQTAEDDWICRECYQTCSNKTRNKNNEHKSHKEIVSAGMLQDKQPRKAPVKRQNLEGCSRQQCINHDTISRRSKSLSVKRRQLSLSDKRLNHSKSESSNQVVLGCRINDWTPEEKKFGYQLQIHLTRLSGDMIKKAKTKQAMCSQRNKRSPRYQQLSIFEAFGLTSVKKPSPDAASPVSQKESRVFTEIEDHESTVPDDNKAKQDNSSVHSLTRNAVIGGTACVAKGFSSSFQCSHGAQRFESSDSTKSKVDSGMLMNVPSRYLEFVRKYFRMQHASLPKKLMHYQDFIRKGILPEWPQSCEFS